MTKAEIIDLTEENLDLYGQCGYKSDKQPGYRDKKAWIRERFAEGLHHKVLVTEKGEAVGGIEYTPGEHAWRPIEAPGYLVVHCLYILKKDYKGKGYGLALLEACLADARDGDYAGVTALVRKGTWMAGEELFLKKGFQVIEEAKPDFKLMVHKLKSDAADPFLVKKENPLPSRYQKGLYVFTSGQCPFLGKCVPEIVEEAEREFGEKARVIEMKSAAEARSNPSLFGTFGIVYNGKIIGDHPMSKTKFRNNMKKLAP